MKTIASLMMAGALAGAAAPAYAGSTSTPAAKPITDTFSLEASPEWGAVSPYTYKDWYAKVGYSHAFSNGVTWGVSLQETFPLPGKKASTQPETTLGYKWKVDTFAFGLSAGLGYNTGTVGGSGGNKNDTVGAYYLASATLDDKLNSKWTWNIINARYRNAFDTTWITPKIATGLTYQIDSRQATYVSVGYAWKDTGDANGLIGDKLNVAVGYKIGF
jgi:hypothetical protein